MPRISEQLNRRSRNVLRPKELPTWWSLFSGALGVLVLVFLAWNLIAGRGGVPAVPSTVPTTVAPVATVPSGPTTPASTPGTPETTAPTTAVGGDTVELSTYAGTRISVPAGAVQAAESLARSSSGVVQSRVLRAKEANAYLIDVTVDLDGAGPSAPGVVAVRVDVDGNGGFIASRVG